MVYIPKNWQYLVSEVLNMSNNKNTAGRFAGKGYYIALILCAAAIGISGYLYYRNVSSDDPSVDNTDGVVDVLNPDDVTKPTGDKPSLPTDSTATEPSPGPLKTAAPIDTQVVLGYAMDCLCYNPTTRDWRVHDGIDYASEAGTPVRAAAAGTVYTAFQDETMGYTVVISHADGYVTTYSSLSADILVSAGDVVELGDVIGYVGCSAVMETALGDHLHFSVSCDGESVDPEAFFLLK